MPLLFQSISGGEHGYRNLKTSSTATPSQHSQGTTPTNTFDGLKWSDHTITNIFEIFATVYTNIVVFSFQSLSGGGQSYGTQDLGTSSSAAPPQYSQGTPGNDIYVNVNRYWIIRHQT